MAGTFSAKAFGGRMDHFLAVARQHFRVIEATSVTSFLLPLLLLNVVNVPV